MTQQEALKKAFKAGRDRNLRFKQWYELVGKDINFTWNYSPYSWSSVQPYWRVTPYSNGTMTVGATGTTNTTIGTCVTTT